MDITENLEQESQIEEQASKSEKELLALTVPRTVLKKKIVFESEEPDLTQSVDHFSKQGATINESFNPYNSMSPDEPDLHPEDEFEHELDNHVNSNIQKSGCWPKVIAFCKLITTNSIYYSIVINVVTLYVLIADYFRIIFFTIDADQIFDIFTIMCFVVLAVDFIFCLICVKNYIFSFFFYLDIIMTLTVVFDITSVSNTMYDKESDKVKQITSNIFRIIRIIRLIRIIKLLRRKEKKPEEQKKGELNNSRFDMAVGQKNDNSLVKKIFAPRESKVTTQLKEMNIQRIILIVLLILIVVPLFDNSLYYQDRSSTVIDKAIFYTTNFIIKNQNNTEGIIAAVSSSLDDSKLTLVQFVIEGLYNFTSNDLPTLREDEIDNFSGTISVNGQCYAVTIALSHRYSNVVGAILNLLNTFFVGVIMIFSILSLNNDMSTLVLNPLERMIGKIRLIGVNPLLALKSSKTNELEEDTNETYIIESAINKITSLLMLGFGQAGCKIVSGFVLDNKRDIDQLIPGEKTYAIFGFCDIKGFSDVTEVLIEDIMLFVNSIADIVHQDVDEFAGATNKNIGEAFLMVWKLMDDGYKYLIDDEYRASVAALPEAARKSKEQTLLMEERYNRQLAEFAVLGFTKVLMDVNTNEQITKFAQNALIATNMPGYYVKMSFGLHIGWAIEGAIGSSYKIDASYLSPNVNLASRVQYACKQFGVNLLFSGNLYSLFYTPELVTNARHIDTVNLKGSKLPIKLYTYNYNYKALKELNEQMKNCTRFKTIKVDIKADLQRQFIEIIKKNQSVTDLGATIGRGKLSKFSSMAEESLVEKKINEPEFKAFFDFDNVEQSDFRSIAKFAVDTYISGDWRSAKSLLERCLKMQPQDGPCQTIYEYMKSREFVLPEGWKNCREMTEK